MQLYPIELIREIKTACKALTMSFSVSEHNAESMGGELHKPRETISRFVNCNGGLSFPELDKFIEHSGNLVLVQYLALKHGYELKQIDDKEQKIKLLEAQLSALKGSDD